MADVLDHPLGYQEVGQFGQAPPGERQAVFGGLGLGDLLDLDSLGQGELRLPPSPVLGIQRLKPVGVEVVDHITDAVFAGEGQFCDLLDGHALGRPQHHLGPSPGHHRAGASPDDPQQPVSFIVIDLAYANPFSHPKSLKRSRRSRWDLDRRVTAKQGKRDRLRH
nr:hypothetical protein [Acrocarpospora corrugata]